MWVWYKGHRRLIVSSIFVFAVLRCCYRKWRQFQMHLNAFSNNAPGFISGFTNTVSFTIHTVRTDIVLKAYFKDCSTMSLPYIWLWLRKWCYTKHGLIPARNVSSPRYNIYWILYYICHGYSYLKCSKHRVQVLCHMQDNVTVLVPYIMIELIPPSHSHNTSISMQTNGQVRAQKGNIWASKLVVSLTRKCI